MVRFKIETGRQMQEFIVKFLLFKYLLDHYQHIVRGIADNKDSPQVDSL